MRQREKPEREQVLSLDLRRGQVVELRPTDVRQEHAHPLLHRLATRHHHTRCWPITQIITRHEQLGLPLFHRRLLCDLRGSHGFEIDVLIAAAVLIAASRCRGWAIGRRVGEIITCAGWRIGVLFDRARRSLRAFTAADRQHHCQSMGPSKHALSLSQFVPQRERAPTATCAPVSNQSGAHELSACREPCACRIATTVTGLQNHPATSDTATPPVDSLDPSAPQKRLIVRQSATLAATRRKRELHTVERETSVGQ